MTRQRFPLPEGFFGPVAFSPQELDECRWLVQNQISSAIHEELDMSQHVESGYHIDRSTWLPVKQKHGNGFDLYRRKNAKANVTNATTKQPDMLAYGQMEGTVNDVLFGCYDENHDEMQAARSFIGENVIDATVLRTIDTATPDDPFRYLGVKWSLSKSLTLRARDLCYLHAMGTSRDRNGNRYGYMLLNSIDLHNCPPFHRNAIIRAKIALTFLLRERLDGFVDIFVQGSFDAAGVTTDKFASQAISEILSTVAKSVQLGEVKKLTLMTIENSNKAATKPKRSSSSPSKCRTCRKKAGVFTTLSTCQVCREPVCKPCRSKKLIFAGSHHTVIKVTCCPRCIFTAKHMRVCPAEEAFSLSGKYHLVPQIEGKSVEGNSDNHHNKDGLSSRQGSIGSDSDTGSSGGSSHDRLTTASSVLDEEVEATIKLIMDRRQTKAPLMPILLDAQQPRSSIITIEEKTPSPLSAISKSTTSSQSPPHRAKFSEREAFFQQLLALQKQTREVSAITRANNQKLHQIRKDSDPTWMD